MKRARLLALATVVLALVPAAAPQIASADPSRMPGCHGSWPVVAHRPDAKLVRLRTNDARPLPCVHETGYTTSESSIAVTNSGAIFYSPANTENTLARSLDSGRTWNLVQPATMEYTSHWNTVDPFVTVDRRTGRLFWVHVTGPMRTAGILVDDSQLPGPPTFLVAAAYGFQVYSSSNDGRSWKTADYRYAPMTDWEKVFVGPPPPRRTGAAQPTGYPNVVYVCANSPMEVGGPGRLCYRSLDGGTTFTLAGYVFPTPSTPDTCAVLNTNSGVVGADGTTYQPVTCGHGSYVVVSRDEGATYSWRQVPAAPPSQSGYPGGVAFQIALDGADNLYALWLLDDHLSLSISRDHARSWSKPMTISPPGVRGIGLPALAAGPRGSLGVTYYGSSKPGAQRLSAYVTETWHALDAHPLLYSAALNDPRFPIFHDYGLTDSPRTDFVGAAYDRNGTLWAGVVKQLSAPDANAHLLTIGYVGHLVAPSSVTRRR